MLFYRTDDEQTKNQGSSDYFLDSADRIHFFLEARAVDPNTNCLLPGLSKHDSINKVGHGLHVVDSVFAEYSQSEKVKQLVHALGWQSAVLPQSMYICKNANIGGEVTSHQDSSFLYTQPRQTCLGLWLALQDATLSNGCIWARPGSHAEPVRRRFFRNPDYFEADMRTPRALDKSTSTDKKTQIPAKLIFELEDASVPLTSSAAPWEGTYALHKNI